MDGVWEVNWEPSEEEVAAEMQRQREDDARYKEYLAREALIQVERERQIAAYHENNRRREERQFRRLDKRWRRLKKECMATCPLPLAVVGGVLFAFACGFYEIFLHGSSLPAAAVSP